MIEVIDNFLDESYINYICDGIGNVDWKYRRNISNDEVDAPWLHGFYHMIHDKSWEISFKSTKNELFLRAIFKIEDKFNVQGCLTRSRLDLTLRSPDNTIHTPHKDFEYDHYACILYCNDSDGDTVIYNETEKSDEYTVQEVISPKKNRLVFFDGKYYHTGHSPSSHNYRVLLNSDFYKR